jgi:hypothetical protein
MSLQNGYANGGSTPVMTVPAPRVIEVPLKEEAGATLEIDCETLEEDTSELCEILNSEEVSLKYWIKFAVLQRAVWERADGGSLSIIDMGWWTMPLICYRRVFIVCLFGGVCADGVATARPTSDELVPVFLFLAALYMHKSRDAPKASPGGSKTSTCLTDCRRRKCRYQGIASAKGRRGHQRGSANQPKLKPRPPHHWYTHNKTIADLQPFNDSQP